MTLLEKIFFNNYMLKDSLEDIYGKIEKSISDKHPAHGQKFKSIREKHTSNNN